MMNIIEQVKHPIILAVTSLSGLYISLENTVLIIQCIAGILAGFAALGSIILTLIKINEKRNRRGK